MKCFGAFKHKSKNGSKSSTEERNNGVISKRAVNNSSSSLQSPRSVYELYKEKEHTLRAFRFSELKEATDGFDRMLKLGEGGFGSVYKGFIKICDHGNDENVRTSVAIKKLNRNSKQV